MQHDVGASTRRPRMHPLLALGLLLTLLASAWAVWWPAEPVGLVAEADSPPQSLSGSPPINLTPRTSTAAAPTQRDTEDLTLSAASRDPFNVASPEPTPATANTLPEPVRHEAASPPLPVPAAPAMNHAVIGRFRTPEGRHLVYVQDGPGAVVAEPGVALSSGYVVEDLSPRELRLRHPLAEHAVSLPLPDAEL
jgi:hypothetical protein